MYNLDNVVKDFPWTAVNYNGVEPWREEGGNWFDEIPRGWGNICYIYLTRLTQLMERYRDARPSQHIVIEQVKEKFGGLRFYYSFSPWSEDEIKPDRQFFERFSGLVNEFEIMTEYVCCDCGTVENLQVYNGWIHIACPDCEKKRLDEYGY